MKYGARNRITAKVTAIKSDQIMSLVKFDVKGPVQMASVLTTESLEEGRGYGTTCCESNPCLAREGVRLRHVQDGSRLSDIGKPRLETIFQKNDVARIF
jgi:hypothetical protein